MKKVASIFLTFLIVFLFSACSGGISGDEAKSYINDFLEKISAEDYEGAKEFLHPERPADVEELFEALKSEENIDFSDFKIEKYTGFRSALYDSTVDGSAYSLTMKVSASDRILQMEIEIVKNDNGYGIYNLVLDFE